MAPGLWTRAEKMNALRERLEKMILLVRGLIVGSRLVSVDACPGTRPQTIWKQCPRETRSERFALKGNVLTSFDEGYLPDHPQTT